MKRALLVLLLVSSLPLAANAEPAHPAKVVVIGIDGGSLNLLDPYSKAGITPNMGALMQQGTRGHLASIWPLRTPQVWTSVATGKLPGHSTNQRDPRLSTCRHPAICCTCVCSWRVLDASRDVGPMRLFRGSGSLWWECVGAWT